jgi:hypothetical protein
VRADEEFLKIDALDFLDLVGYGVSRDVPGGAEFFRITETAANVMKVVTLINRNRE